MNNRQTRVFGLQGLSQPEYSYIVSTSHMALTEELKQQPVLADAKAGWTYLTQYDCVSKKQIGSVKTIHVFIEGSKFSNVFPEFYESTPERSGVYWYPKHLGPLLKESYPTYIFLEGSSTKNVLKSDDKIAEVARKILKRLALKTRIKRYLVLALKKTIPIAVSVGALVA
jgi:hypothetical protein